MINTFIMFFGLPIGMVAVLASVADAVLEYKENGTLPPFKVWVLWVLFMAGYCYNIHCYNELKETEGAIKEAKKHINEN